MNVSLQQQVAVSAVHVAARALSEPSAATRSSVGSVGCWSRAAVPSTHSRQLLLPHEHAVSRALPCSARPVPAPSCDAVVLPARDVLAPVQ